MTPREAWSKAAAWMDRAEELQREGMITRAEAAMVEALPLLREAEDHMVEGNAWIWLGQVRLELGETAGAVEAFRTAVSRFEAGGIVSGQARAMVGLGEALLRDGSPDESIGVLREAARLAGLAGSGIGEALGWCLLGEASIWRGDYLEARAALSRAVRLAQRLDVAGLEARALAGLGRTALETGSADQAMRQASAAAQVARSVGDWAGWGWGLLLEADASRVAGRHTRAWWVTRKARSMFHRSRCQDGVLAANSRLARWPWWRAVWGEIGRRLVGGPRRLPPPRTGSMP